MSDVGPLLIEWMSCQRWYATKGRKPNLRVAGTLESASGDATITTYFLADEAGDRTVNYQVPIVSRPSPSASNAAALIGRVDDDFLYDGPHDSAYTGALLRTISEQLSLAGAGAQASGIAFVNPGEMLGSRVLTGEQSNTSIIYDIANGHTPQAIVKVFRVLQHGDNTDVTTQAALSANGSTRVPASLGCVTASWPDPAAPDGTARGHLAFAQEFLPGLEDAWRVALGSASSGEDFSSQAYDLGVAVAEVHATLAMALPTIPASRAQIDAALGSMHRRIDIAAREVPSIAPLADRIRAVYNAAGDREWPLLQRIHGDLHLGQALASPERGWVLLDFEGEPMRPMPERSRPDVPLRDIAGMLRSFDYVSGSLAQQHNAGDPRVWSATARRAFVDGYIARSGVNVRAERTLLDAFELDKAVYETIYETRNRPDWVGIPLTAVERLLERSAPRG